MGNLTIDTSNTSEKTLLGQGGFCKVFDNGDGTVSKELFRKLSEPDLITFFKQKEFSDKKLMLFDIPFKEFEVTSRYCPDGRYHVELIQEKISSDDFLSKKSLDFDWFGVVSTFLEYISTLENQTYPKIGIDFRAENFAYSGGKLTLIDNYPPIIISEGSLSLFSRYGRLDIPICKESERYIEKYYSKRALFLFSEYLKDTNSEIAEKIRDLLKGFNIDVSFTEKVLTKLSWKIFCKCREKASIIKQKSESIVC